MRVAILCNGKDLALWQRRAVDAIARDHELFVLACGDEPAPRRRLSHFAYYALNLVTVRNRMTRRVPFPDPRARVAARIDVDPVIDGNWAELPGAALAWLKEQRVDAIVKFGLGLLRVPDQADLPTPILSFHHGDPSAYRGRPAGFWELVDGASFVGQVVQILSNRLDAGRVLAFAETRVVGHSYRRTLVDAYALSPHLLPVALRAAEKGEELAVKPVGRNCRLPGNWTVLRFIAARWILLLRWLAYGAFVEKQWNVAVVEPVDAADPIAAVRSAEHRTWTVPELVAPYRFYADPFFAPDNDGLIVEALNRWSGKGELVRLRGNHVHGLGSTGGHTSYPAPFSEDGKDFLVPEISEWSQPGIYSLEAGRVSRVADLDIDELGLVDPTLFGHLGTVFLFANTEADGVNLLHLWTAPSLFGRFEPHPSSPVRLSARGSRMAGQILTSGGRLYRLGQDARHGYGDGVLLFEIVELSRTAYREELAGDVAFSKVRGPHTVNVRGSRMVFDFYRERLSLLAGIRRLASKL